MAQARTRASKGCLAILRPQRSVKANGHRNEVERERNDIGEHNQEVAKICRLKGDYPETEINFEQRSDGVKYQVACDGDG